MEPTRGAARVTADHPPWSTYARHLTDTASPGAWTVIDGATASGTAAARIAPEMIEG